MKVEVWSDLVCPFCYIGKRKLEEALGKFGHADQVETVYHSFELNPNEERDSGTDIYDHLAAKKGMTRANSIAMHDHVAKQAEMVGLKYNFGSAVLTNTFDAHRMIHWAGTHDKMKEMTERLFKAYFTESRHIGDHPTLAALAGEVGLDPGKALQMLESDAYSAEVRKDEQEARNIGVNGVPFFVINRKYAVSGAQAPEIILNALNKAWNEETA